jgi:tRNA threonylcarbamoyladenosine biosynthesis protein TsaB
MLILAFDSAVAACSVAVWQAGRVLAAAREVMDQGQAEALMPMIARVMEAAKVDYAALDRIAVTVGPGSFTGVRVGLAAARGLGLAAGKPIVGVMTTEVLAAAVEDNRSLSIVAAIDTKRGDLYVQRFSPQAVSMGTVVVVAPADLAAWCPTGEICVVGDGAKLAVETLGARAQVSAASALPDAVVLARLAATRAPEPGGPLPVYARAPDAIVPEHGGRLRP